MGSIDAEQEKELAVLVTGFGPFREAYPVNPSWEIAALLPDYLPADRAKDANNARRTTITRDLPPVRIVKLPSAVRTSYKYTRELVPKLWDEGVDGRKIDYAVHIGMAGPQLVYSIERRGHRDGYRSKDVDGKLLEDEKAHEEMGERWIWHGVPHELLTDFDIDDVHRKWVRRSPKNLDLRVSEDAGHYLCDFIYFSSLAHLWKQQRDKKVVFFHVPLHSDPDSLKRGVELVLTLIRSLVESELEKKET
ncbi:putative pyroglutamyl peptidase type I [Xylaria sp. FL0043]|nr:putative pyroglutamyl peptidase type I [Xylaria sp. FL0043]